MFRRRCQGPGDSALDSVQLDKLEELVKEGEEEYLPQTHLALLRVSRRAAISALAPKTSGPVSDAQKEVASSVETKTEELFESVLAGGAVVKDDGQ